MERFVPGTEGEIWYEHWHRYHFVKALAAGRRVVDVACGEGYGAALLAGAAAHVTAIDAAADVVARARKRYGALANVEWVEGRGEALPLGDGSVEMLVSFETLEHLPRPERFLDECARVLRPDGELFVSTPNKPIYSDARNHSNPYHLHEYGREDLLAALRSRFRSVSLFGQRVDVYSAIWPLDEAPAQCQLLDARLREADRPAPGIADPVYLIARCGHAELPPLPAFSLFSNRDHERSREAESLQARLERMQAQVERAEAAYLASQRQLAALAAETGWRK